jgi:hypothetical protein
LAVAISVALIGALSAAFTVIRAAQRVGLGAHQGVDEHRQQLAQNIGAPTIAFDGTDITTLRGLIGVRLVPFEGAYGLRCQVGANAQNVGTAMKKARSFGGCQPVKGRSAGAVAAGGAAGMP